MSNLLTRRRLIAGSAGALVPLAGCSSILDSDVTIVVTILNATDESQDTYVEFNHPDDDDFHRSRVKTVAAGIAYRTEFSVPPGTYEMELVIDDVTPRPEKTVEWEVTENEDECERARNWVISPAETGLDLKVVKRNCEDSGS